MTSSPQQPGSPAAPPRLRGREREARDNDRLVLGAARDVFAEQGWDAPMSAVAERAGVGVASIYRRYPSKPFLVHALRLLALSQVTALALESAASGAPSTVEHFVLRHVQEAASPLVTTFGWHVQTSPEIDAAAEELRLALTAIVDHDVAAGMVPAGFTPADLMLAITHLRPVLPTTRERTVEIHQRHAHYLLLGLRESIGREGEVPGVGSTWQEWLDLNSAAAVSPS